LAQNLEIKGIFLGERAPHILYCLGFQIAVIVMLWETSMQPPQNPYGQPNFGQPQGPFAPQPSQQPPRGVVSLDVIGEGWKLLSANMGVWALAGFIYLAVSGVFSLLTRATQTVGPNGLPQNSPISFLISLVSVFVTTFLVAGLMKMALSTVSTGRADLSQLGSGGSVFLSLIGANLLVGFLVGFGFLLCIVPGVIAAAGLMLVTPLVVSGQGAFAAIGASWSALSKQLGSAIVLAIVMGLIILVSMIPLFLGLIITIPLLQIVLALVYRDVFGIGGTPMQNTGYAPPPIANPNF